jgi:tetratricopeptide (TPR) repeat protein
VAEANLSRLLARAGQNDAAITALDHAVRDAPGDLKLRLSLAALYDKSGHPADALMLYRQVLEAAERNGVDNLPLDGIRRRVAYLDSPAAGSSPEPSTTLPVDNR